MEGGLYIRIEEKWKREGEGDREQNVAEEETSFEGGTDVFCRLNYFSVLLLLST
jgi:hypothetical protein